VAWRRLLIGVRKEKGMPKLSVLVGKKGEVLGTFRGTSGSAGTGAPVARFRASAGQKVIEVELDEATARLEPEELHKTIKAKHLKLRPAARASSRSDHRGT
jgi:hypothetical protein